MRWTPFRFTALAGSLLMVLGCPGSGSSSGGNAPAPAAPTITSFVANPTIITSGGTSALTGVFANGTGFITPGSLSASSGTGVNVTPTATATYTLTVTNSVGAAVTKTTTVTVNPSFMPLEFPFADPAVIARMASWGIPNWSGSEPHNGMDFIVRGEVASARIVSPTAGVVRSVSSSENPYSNPPGQLMVTISITVNAEWEVYLVLEPSSTDTATKAAQLAAVRVQPGQQVGVGTQVADLLVGTLGYPSLHYMVIRGNVNVCAYSHSSEAAKRTIETIAHLPNGNVPGGQICVGQP